MRRGLLIAGSILGLIVLIVAALFGYAAFNLNSIIDSNRERILAKISDALGHPVAVSDIKASFGWGVSLDLNGLTVADDPAFSNQPMISVPDIYCRIELIPLLAKHIKVVRFDIENPEVRVIRNPAGQLNVATLGRKQPGRKFKPHGTPAPGALQASPIQAAPPAYANPNRLAEFSVNSFSISNGTIICQDQRLGPNPVAIRKLDLEVENIRLEAPVDMKLALAAASDRQNLKLTGQIGPLVREGGIDIQAIPLAFAGNLGPITTADLKSLGRLASAMPEKLSIDGPVSGTVKISGTSGAPEFAFNADLKSNRVVYAGAFDKPAGVALAVSARGARSNEQFEIADANLTLADLRLKATDLVIEKGRLGARLETNRFDLSDVAKTVSALRKEKLSGQAEFHGRVAMQRSKPNVDGILTLINVALSPGGNLPGLSGVNGDLKINGNSAEIGPLDFGLGSGHARLVAHAQSLQPLESTYDFSAGQLRTADLFPSRPPDETLNNLKLAGTAAGTPSEPMVNANLSSSSGSVNHVAYQNLELSARYRDRQVDVKALSLGAFGGTITATAQAEFAAPPRFEVAANLNNVDLQQALASQKSKGAKTIRGVLTGNVQAAGAGRRFDQIKPTLAGGGKLTVRDGKLIGINVVATALQKTRKVPGIGELVPGPLVANHPELFKNPNTDIDQAELTFVLQGPRITTHDLTVQSADYSMLGDGWFDLDKRVDLAAHILFSPDFSSEWRSDKKNIVFLENQNGQVEIPLQVIGQMPKLLVVPDVADLARRAAAQAMKRKGQKFFGKLFGKKGLGGLFGGGSN